MSRRKTAPVREVLPDPKYGSKIVTKFIARMMVHGKKSINQRNLYGAMDLLKEKNERRRA